MKTKTKLQVRQGDVLIERIDKLPEKITPKNEEGRVILAHGEVTGHAHEIESPQLATHYEVAEAMHELGDLDDAGPMSRTALEVDADTNLIHQEHAMIPIQRGTYRVTRQREYTPSEIRNVAD